MNFVIQAATDYVKTDTICAKFSEIFIVVHCNISNALAMEEPQNHKAIDVSMTLNCCQNFINTNSFPTQINSHFCKSLEIIFNILLQLE